MTKRKLSADLNLTKNKIAIRQRDGRLKNKSNKKNTSLKTKLNHRTKCMYIYCWFVFISIIIGFDDI